MQNISSRGLTLASPKLRALLIWEAVKSLRGCYAPVSTFTTEKYYCPIVAFELGDKISDIFFLSEVLSLGS